MVNSFPPGVHFPVERSLQEQRSRTVVNLEILEYDFRIRNRQAVRHSTVQSGVGVGGVNSNNCLLRKEALGDIDFVILKSAVELHMHAVSA